MDPLNYSPFGSGDRSGVSGRRYRPVGVVGGIIAAVAALVGGGYALGRDTGGAVQKKLELRVGELEERAKELEKKNDACANESQERTERAKECQEDLAKDETSLEELRGSLADMQAARSKEIEAREARIARLEGCLRNVDIDVDCPIKPISWRPFQVRARRTSCVGASDGAAEVVFFGERGDFGVRWFTHEEEPRIDGLKPGDYWVKVRRGEGRWVTQEFEIDGPQAPLEVRIVKIEEAEEKGSFVRVEAAASGGHGEYSYLWSTGVSGSRVSLASPGLYSLAVRDKGGCVATTVVDLGGESATAELLKGADVVDDQPGGVDAAGRGERDHPPRLTERLRPAYPAAARPYRRDGYVVVQVFVSEAGEVERFKVKDGDILGFPAAAEAAVRAARFEPGIEAGKPKAMWTAVRCWWNGTAQAGGVCDTD